MQIAIIGYSGSFPGADSPEKLWDLCSQGHIGLSTKSEDIIRRNLPDDLIKQEGFRPVGGGPEDFKSFDAQFFGYSPKEAGYLDPQIRKSLETAWNAFEHAGYSPNHVKGPVGVYLASSLNTYFFENLFDRFEKSNESERSHILFLNEPDFLATRIAYHFNWSGPAFTIKCGCSGSLVAIHQACQALLNYECDSALCGGVAIKSRYHYGYIHESNDILSENGLCCPFSDAATGTVFANGIGMVVLKRLSDAIEDGDTIHGVICGTAVNNDGQDKVGYMAPSISGQVASMQAALIYAGLSPKDISYVETHGTGTEIGDPIEFKGLLEVFKGCPKRSIHLGAVKGNIGHLDAASGVVGLIKVIEEMRHQTVSPIVHFSTANPKMEYAHSPFIINQSKSHWTAREKGRYAAVSSFGIGGTNAQLIIGEYEKTQEFVQAGRSYFFPFSAKSKEALENRIKELKLFLQKNSNCSIRDISYTLLVGRASFSYRCGVSAQTTGELLQKLTDLMKECIQIPIKNEVFLDEELFEDVSRLEVLWKNGAVIRTPQQPLVGCKRIPLPGYPFAKEEYWIEPEKEKGNQKILDPSKWFYLPYWKREQIATKIPDLNGKNVLIFAESTGLSEELQKAISLCGAIPVMVYPGEFFSFDQKHCYTIHPGNERELTELLQQLQEQGKFPDLVFHFWNWEEGRELSFDETQQKGLYFLVALCKAGIQVKGKISFDLSIVCQGVANVSGHEKIYPSRATLLGISQVFPKEYEGKICQLIDLCPYSSSKKISVKAILYEIASGRSCEVALRGGFRFIKDYTSHPLTEDRLGTVRLSKEKNYLIIGGLGNFGMELCEFIAIHHQSNLFLTTRTPFPHRSEWISWLAEKGVHHSISKKILKIQEIEKWGSRIEVFKADVSKYEELAAVRHQIYSEHGVIAGVIHAAGIVESGMIQNKTIHSFEQVFEAKVHGTKNVCELFLQDKPDFILLCSSMNSIIGGLGQIDNTAANAFVDAYAEFCVTQGNQSVFAINWGAVNEARARNYSALPQFADLSREHIKNKMTKEEIFDVYRRLFSTEIAPRVIVSTINFNEVIRNWNRVGSLMELVKEVRIEKKNRPEFLSKSYCKPITEMEKVIAKQWQELLGICEIGKEDNFFELGGNSLVAIQFIGKLTQRFLIRVHTMSIYEYPTLEAFAAYAEQLNVESREKRELLIPFQES